MAPARKRVHGRAKAKPTPASAEQRQRDEHDAPVVPAARQPMLDSPLHARGQRGRPADGDRRGDPAAHLGAHSVLLVLRARGEERSQKGVGGRDPPLGGGQRAATELGHLIERLVEQVPEDPGAPLARRQSVEGDVEQRDQRAQLGGRLVGDEVDLEVRRLEKMAEAPPAQPP